MISPSQRKMAFHIMPIYDSHQTVHIHIVLTRLEQIHLLHYKITRMLLYSADSTHYFGSVLFFYLIKLKVEFNRDLQFDHPKVFFCH